VVAGPWPQNIILLTSLSISTSRLSASSLAPLAPLRQLVYLGIGRGRKEGRNYIRLSRAVGSHGEDRVTVNGPTELRPATEQIGRWKDAGGAPPPPERAAGLSSVTALFLERVARRELGSLAAVFRNL
jgi:hypothetical protein